MQLDKLSSLFHQLLCRLGSYWCNLMAIKIVFMIWLFLIYANLTFSALLKLLKIVSFSRTVKVESAKHSCFPLISALSVTSSSNLFISLNLAFSLFLSLLTYFFKRNRCFEDLYHYIMQLLVWGNKTFSKLQI